MITKFKIFEELDVDKLKVGEEVVCISPLDHLPNHLTLGKKYIIQDIWKTRGQQLLDIINDEGEKHPYGINRFLTPLEYDAKKFNI